MSKTIEERAVKYVTDKMFVNKDKKVSYSDCTHVDWLNSLEDNSAVFSAYVKGAEEQVKIDKERFDMFLCGLRNSNMWEGREWRFQRLWREFQESMDKNK